MQLTADEFRRLGYQAVDLAASYLEGLPAKPVFQRISEVDRQRINFEHATPRNGPAGRRPFEVHR